MTKLTDFLEKLGLSDVEASLYNVLLENGPISVRDLAEITKMKRTTAYFYVDQLIEKGLVVKLTRESQKLVTVTLPKESLQAIVEKKEQEANKLNAEFTNILKVLKTELPHVEPPTDAEVKYFKGKNGVKKIYEEALSGAELRSYVNVAEIDEVFPENFKLFEDAFNRNAKINMYEIVEDSPKSEKLIEIANKRPTYHYKILPTNLRITAQDILIYEGTVAIINLKGNIHGVVLRNRDLATNLKMLFDFIWNSIL